MDVHLITHNDLDAAACVLVLKCLLRHDVNLHWDACSYDDIERVVHDTACMLVGSSKNKIIVADIAPSMEGLKLLDQCSVEPFLIDHHVTRRDDLKEFKWAHYSEDRCGAYALVELFDKHLSHLAHIPSTERHWHAHQRLEANLKSVIEGVDAWDMWKLDSPHREFGEQLNRLFRFLGMSRWVEALRDRECVNHKLTLDWHELNAVLIDQERGYINHKLRTADVYTDPREKCRVAVVAVERFHSEVARAMLEHLPDVKYVLLTDTYNGGLSLRSRGAVDVGALAKSLGGGGHAQAAGVPKDKAQDALQHLLLRFIQ